MQKLFLSCSFVYRWDSYFSADKNVYKENSQRLMHQQLQKKDKTQRKPRMRMETPFQTKEQIMDKRIQLSIYVGNLPNNWNKDEIRKFFETYGTILEVKLLNSSLQTTKTAVVKFASLGEADKAIEALKGQTLPGASRQLKINWLDSEQHRLGVREDGEFKLFIGSLPRMATQSSLYEVLSVMGKIKSLKLQETQYWAIVQYENKQSALLAIKYLNGQTYLHGSKVPLEVRLKERKYNSFMTKKHEKDVLDPYAFSTENTYHQIKYKGQYYYYNYSNKRSQFDPPPPGAKVFYSNTPQNFYIQPETSTVNDMPNQPTKQGPPGSNLFLFHLPHDMKDSEIYQLFSQFGKLHSTKVMTQLSGRSKGIGFVSYHEPSSARQAIEVMNGIEIRGKRLKVEINEKDQRIINKKVNHQVEPLYE